MFTGIIQEVGHIFSIRTLTEGKEIVLKAPHLAKSIKVDDSISVNGVCQTAVKVVAPFITVQCVSISLQKTNLGQLRTGEAVNLELALRPMDYLGGHFVQGHVNGTAELIHIESRGQNKNLTFCFDPSFRPYLVPEGPVALEGVSLTVARVTKNTLTVSIIPHTNRHTTLNDKKIGQKVNLEVDMFAKYIESILDYRQNTHTHPGPGQNFLQSLLENPL